MPMNEAEWLGCADPTPMLEFLRGKPSDRTLRLFGCACCRAIWGRLTDQRSREGVMVAECYADGQASTDQLVEAHRIAYAAYEDGGLAGYLAAAYLAPAVSLNAALSTAEAALKAATPDAATSACKIQADMLRDIVDNPFRPSSPLPPAVLAWNDRTIPRLAEAIYEDRKLPEGTLDNSRLAILADALLDAGCEDDSLIQHCRSEGPHVRGCWAVDLILGKS
jgi:hypothetical protein